MNCTKCFDERKHDKQKFGEEEENSFALQVQFFSNDFHGKKDDR